MAITKDLLEANPSLSVLTDEQKNAITVLSANDEQTVINTKIGEVHGNYDADILAVTGEKKNNGEKTYDFMKRVLGTYKTKVEGSTTELEALKTTKKDLEEQIKKGATDPIIVKKLTDAEQTIAQLQESIKVEQKKVTDSTAQFEQTSKSLRAEFALDQAVGKLKFKAGIPDSVAKTLADVAKKEILANAVPDFIEKADGTKQLVFRDANGEIIKNKEKLSEPFTAEDFVFGHTSLKEIIDLGGKGAGSGTGPKGGGTGGSGTSLDLSGVKTQSDADEVIISHLLKSGLTKGSVEFQKKQTEIRTELKVGEMPMR